MKPEPSTALILDSLREAGQVWSKNRALLFLLRGTFWLLLAIPVLLLADVLFHFSTALRLAGIGTLLLAALAVGVTAFLLALAFQPPLLRVARLLEEKNPALGTKLVNILQLDSQASDPKTDPLTRSLTAQAIADSAAALKPAELPAQVTEPRLKLSFHLALAAPALILLLTLLGGTHARQQWLRFLDPFGDHPPFSLTQLEITNPAEKVIYGGTQTIEVRASGHKPGELFLTGLNPENPAESVTIPMAARGDGTYVARLENIRTPLNLTAHTPDDRVRSRHQLLEVILTPEIRAAAVTLTPPSYTGLPEVKKPYQFRALTLLEGTEIQVSLTSNRPLGPGKLKLETAEQKPATTPLTPDPKNPQTATARFTATDSARLTFLPLDEAGNPPAENPAAILTVTRDQPPAIALAAPETDSLIVENYLLPVIVDATDDYGLATLRLHHSVAGNFAEPEITTFEKPGIRRHRLESTLNLAALGAKSGDVITLFAEAVDIRPNPQLTRTTTRRLEVITEAEYNDLLREEADVALVAGKYEDLLNRLDSLLEEQNQLAEEMERIEKKPEAEQTPEEILAALDSQKELDQKLTEMAEEMKNFGRENPVYDFEKGLQERLAEQAEAIEESVEKNQAEMDAALNSPEPGSPLPELADAARAHRDRLQGDQEKSKEEILEPLQDLAQLQELMKSFRRFEDLAEEQRELADQSAAYREMENLNAEDRLALRNLGNAQREMAQKLSELQKKLEHDAEAAKEEFPEAAQSAKELAEGMDDAGMNGLARGAAQDLLSAKPGEGNAKAENLAEEMDRLLGDNPPGGGRGQGLQEGLDRALQANRGLKPGNSLRQMLMSRNFRPLPAEGAAGAGLAGQMASAMMQGRPMLLGGESLMSGDIAANLAAGRQGVGDGLAGGPTATLDPLSPAALAEEQSRRTSTPNTTTLLYQYEQIADAYFRRLTAQPTPTP